MRFCIVGTGRCGTTLLGRLLGAHPDIHVFEETHWIPKLYQAYGTGPARFDSLAGIVDRTTHIDGSRVTVVDFPRVHEELGRPAEIGVVDFCNAVGTHFAELADKSGWADKTPDYGAYMEVLQRLWPDCKFVHVVRNGPQVVASMMRHPGYRWLAGAGETNWVPASFNDYFRGAAVDPEPPVQDYIELWAGRLSRTRDEARRLREGSYMEIRFEDLVREPRVTLAETASFVGLSGTGSWPDAELSSIRPAVADREPPAEIIEAFGRAGFSR